jgi:hypothetical protein
MQLLLISSIEQRREKVQLGIIELQHYGRTLNLHKLLMVIIGWIIADMDIMDGFLG